MIYVQYANLMQGKFYGYAIVIDVHSIGYSLILLICNFTMAMLSFVKYVSGVWCCALISIYSIVMTIK